MGKQKYEEVLNEEELMTLAENIDPMPVDAAKKGRIWQRIDNRINGDCPDGGTTITEKDSDWFDLDDHISIKVLVQDHEKKQQTALWRLKPGAVITSHRHDTEEECLVLEGSISIGSHVLNQGDFHVMGEGSYHPEIISESGALLYLKHDMHERLMGPASTLLA